MAIRQHSAASCSAHLHAIPNGTTNSARRLGRPPSGARGPQSTRKGSIMDAKTPPPRRQHQVRQLTIGDKNYDVPGLRGHDRPGRRSTSRKLYGAGRHLHLRPGLHLDGELRVQDHLYRRRRGHPALSRLSDRAARRARRLPRDLLPAALRRTADRGAEGRLRLSRDPPHDGARADEPLLPGLPARRASDGGDGRLRSARCRRSITTPPTSPIRTSA